VIYLEILCQIEVIKDGRDFAARAHLSSGAIKEYRHPKFEEAITEMVIDLQSILEETEL
jgi:hypothetical protein